MASVPPARGPLLDSTVVAMERRNIMRGAMREVANLNDMMAVVCVECVEWRLGWGRGEIEESTTMLLWQLLLALLRFAPNYEALSQSACV